MNSVSCTYFVVRHWQNKDIFYININWEFLTQFCTREANTFFFFLKLKHTFKRFTWLRATVQLCIKVADMTTFCVLFQALEFFC